MTQDWSDADAVRAYLELSHLLDEVEQTHPRVSASLRLTLARSHRRYRAGWLNSERFHEVLEELTVGAVANRGTAAAAEVGVRAHG